MSEDTRTKLPSRRQQVIENIDAHGWQLTLGVGFAPDGTAREIFLDGFKSGQDIEALLDDACILASMLLQHGYSAAQLADKLGREGPQSPDQASPIGWVLARLVEIERDEGQAVQATYDQVAPQFALSLVPDHTDGGP